VTPPANGDVASATDFNTEVDDIASALTASLTANGAKVWAGAQNAGGYKITNLATPTANADAATKAYVDGATYLDATLTALAGLATGANKVPYSTGTDTFSQADLTAFGRSLIDDADAAAGRSTLGLGSIATQASSSVTITGGSVTGITDLAVADGGTGASDAATARTNLGLAIGTNVQAYDADLAAVAGLTSNGLIARTGAGTAAARTLTAGTGITVTNGDGVSGNPTAAINTAAALTWTAAQTFNSNVSLPAGFYIRKELDPSEGGQFYLQKSSGSTLAGDLIVDLNQNTFRVFEGGGSFRGFSVDITGCGSQSTLYHAGNLPGTALTWTAAQTFSARLLSSGGPNTVPAAGLHDNALQISNSGDQSYGLLVGTTGAGISWLQAQRVDGTATTYALNLNPNGGVVQVGGNTVYHAGNLPSTALTWTAAQTFNAEARFASTFNWYSSGAAADEKFYDVTNSGGGLSFRAVNDAYSAATTWLQVARSGTTVAEIELNATTLDFNGNCDVSGTLTRAGNTVYDASNLPGTAITWTAAQTFSNTVTNFGGTANNVDKYVRHVTANYNSTAESEGWNPWGVNSLSGSHVVFIGGGDGAYNAATAIEFYTAADTSTRTGTKRLQITSSGAVQDGSGNTFYHAGNLPGTAITWTAKQTFSSADTDLSNAAPRINWIETDAAADNGRWRVQANGGVWQIYAYNDAGSVFTNAFSITRSGTTITNITLAASEVSANNLKGRIAQSSETSGTLTSASANETIQATGDITIANSVFAAGDVIVIYAGASSRTLTEGSGVTMRLAGTATTGSRTLAARGIATLFFVSASEVVVGGSGVS
jgi:hypothetical protein